ncbi:ATP/GTP-binding protein [Streptomyces sp. NPDC056527]|uniref:ATP/GTP-binding protein n=1 Tax=Streptomyces sp. NPDC056527 TaxID=3345853 RepID=UPI0036B6FD04
MLALATILVSASAVAADGNPSAGNCDDFFCVGIEVPGKGGHGGSGGASGGTGTTPAKNPTEPPPCTYALANPQPPAGSAFWEGHDPSEGGAIYERTCGPLTSFVYGGPGGPPAAAVDPAVLAQQALDKMRLRAPKIGITPKAGGKGVVGMPVYMWTEKGPETYGPNVASASAGGITVRATAKVSRIVWSMGDGKTVTCTTAGTPYKAEYGKKPSPDCGHRYTTPSSITASGKYHVTATSTWTIDWTATSGPTGQLTEARTSAVDIAVAEVQVLN